MGRYGKRRKKKPEGMGKCIFTTIFYPFVMIMLSIWSYSIGRTTIEGTALSVLCSAIASLLIYVGGFYWFIIPLPFLSIDFVGSVRNIHLALKVLLGAMIVALIFGWLFSLAEFPPA